VSALKAAFVTMISEDTARQIKKRKAEAEARKLAAAQILNTAKTEEREHERIGRIEQVRCLHHL
jgi:hypothetical protein